MSIKCKLHGLRYRESRQKEDRFCIHRLYCSIHIMALRPCLQTASITARQVHGLDDEGVCLQLQFYPHHWSQKEDQTTSSKKQKKERRLSGLCSGSTPFQYLHL